MPLRRMSALLLILFTGCGPAPEPSDPSVLIVRGPAGSTVRLSALDKSSAEVDNVEFQLKDAALVVGEKSFGPVKLGDVVTIGPNGDVRINGNAQTASP